MNTQWIAKPSAHIEIDSADLKWYAIADAARSPDIPSILSKNRTFANLLGASEGTELASLSPYLIALPAPSDSDELWR